MDTWIRDEVVTGRAGVAGLRRVLYGRTERDRLRKQLDDMLLPGGSVLRCELERAKFKPGRKLTGYYRVTVGGPGHPCTRAVEVVWSAAPDSDEPVGAEAAMQEEARRGGVAAPFRSLRDHADRRGAGVRVAPLDVAYPQLVQMSRPDHVRDVLGTVGATTGFRAPGRYAVTALRYRPRQRHVLRYDPDGEAGSGSVFAKLYRNGASTDAVVVARHLADRLEHAGGPLTAVRPLGAWRPGDAVLYPRVAGTPLSQQLGRLAPGWQGHVVTAGVLLRALHDSGPGELAPILRRHDLDAEVRSIVRAAEHLAPLLPATAARVAELLDNAQAAAAEVPPEPPGLAHGDYKADHVWVNRDRLTLLDFDTCCLAEPALDVGKFLADLSWWFESSGRPGLRAAQTLLLQGYGDAPPERLARARIYEAVVLAKITIRRLRRFDREWEAQTAERIDSAALRLRPTIPAQRARPSGSLAR